MFAVIKSGGKQYRVAPNDVISVERVAAQVGETIGFDHVLMLVEDGRAIVGQPLVAGARVSAEVLGQNQGEKIVVFKKRRRKDYRRRLGHRQALTLVRITEIVAEGEAAAAAPKAESEAGGEPAASKARARKPAGARPAARKAATGKAPGKASAGAPAKAPAKKAAKAARPSRAGGPGAEEKD